MTINHRIKIIQFQIIFRDYNINETKSTKVFPSIYLFTRGSGYVFIPQIR